MEAFKFACPVCGQHISCEPDKAGSHMECPTCFQTLVVPHPPADRNSKFILTASKVQTRSIPRLPYEPRIVSREKPFPLGLLVSVVVIVAGIAAGIVFRDKLFRTGQQGNIAEKITPSGKSVSSNAPAPVAVNTPADTNWTLNLTDVTLPQEAATGRIHGRAFTCERSVLTGGRLDLRQGGKGPPDLGATLYLHAARGEDLAGKTVNIPPDMANAPEVKLRWKDEQDQPQNKSLRSGYALRLEFGPVTGKRIPGKIYLCTPDDQHSWIAGTFDAEVRKPKPQ